MAMNRRILLLGGGFLALMGFRATPRAVAAATPFPVSLSDAEWERRLDARQFDVLRREGTERPFSSPLNHETREGRFACAGCNTEAFSSKTKFDSHTGWPSFWAPLAGAVADTTDDSFGMTRTEVHCATCGGHLGHVFNDGPKPTGLRYCMNGVAMRFVAGPA